MVKPDWLKDVVDASQRVAGLCDQLDTDEAQQVLTAFARALPPPTNPVERLLLRALLLDVAWRCGEVVHARAARRCAGRCAFQPALVLERFLRSTSQDPRRAFLSWVTAFSVELARTHPPSAATRAARVIREHYQRPLSVTALARRFHVTPPQLRRAFQREFGMSLREYQRTMRLVEALPQVATGKIDAIALKVGYKSKKNFYRAFQHVAGLTPTAFRNLPHERAMQVIDSIKRDVRRAAL